MKIDIQDLIAKKITEMETNKIIENKITEGLEKLIITAVDSTFSDYKLRNSIEKKMADEVSSTIQKIDFQTYNSFISEKIKDLTENVLRIDLSEKLNKYFNELFLADKNEYKLSEIFNKYREMVITGTDCRDQHDRECFHIKMEKNSYHEWYNIELSEEQDTKDKDIQFTLHVRSDGSGWVGGVYLEGESIKDKFKCTYLNDVELLLIKLSLNKIKIIIDVDDIDDIDDTYDCGD